MPEVKRPWRDTEHSSPSNTVLRIIGSTPPPIHMPSRCDEKIIYFYIFMFLSKDLMLFHAMHFTLHAACLSSCNAGLISCYIGLSFEVLGSLHKVVQIWPGQTVTCLRTISPGHIWTTFHQTMLLWWVCTKTLVEWQPYLGTTATVTWLRIWR